jgi:hypothetical protein
VFVTERKARVQLPAADLDPSGRARLIYQQAEALFSESSGGATLHQLRHGADPRRRERHRDADADGPLRSHFRPVAGNVRGSRLRRSPDTRLNTTRRGAGGGLEETATRLSL